MPIDELAMLFMVRMHLKGIVELTFGDEFGDSSNHDLSKREIGSNNAA